MTTVLPMDSHASNTDPSVEPAATKIQFYTLQDWDRIPQLKSLPEDMQFQIKAVARVMPFRVNQYVIDELIDWTNIPNDPIFQVTFPQPGMLRSTQLKTLLELINNNANEDEISALANKARKHLVPLSASDLEHDVPVLNGDKLEGLRHKFRHALLFSPLKSSGNHNCYSYYSNFSNGAQFIDPENAEYPIQQIPQLQSYLAAHTEVTDLLITGCDPMIMRTHHLQNCLEPLINQSFEHLQTIRINTRILSFWPQRFVSDSDASDLLRLLEKLVKNGKHVAIMAHFNHWRELETAVVRKAIARILSTGATIHGQGSILANINDNADTWARLWKSQVKLGIIPYYAFVEHDMGSKNYFAVPIARAWTVFRDAMQQVSGLGRTARGPIMNSGPGKIEVQGITEINGEQVFVMRMIQGRNPDWVQKPFFAGYNESASWISDLKPAFGAQKFFFEDEYHQICTTNPWRKQFD